MRKGSIAIVRHKEYPIGDLYWRKSVYHLWFDYAKVSPKNIPSEFGNLDDFSDFEEWWNHPDHGYTLFCEPKGEDPLKVVQSISKKKDVDQHILYLRLNLLEKSSNLKRWFKSLLQKYQGSILAEPKSKARFQPSVPSRHIRRDALKKYLENWKMRESGMSRKEIYKMRYPYNDFNTDSSADNQLRVISREYQKAKEVFANIEKGTFP